MPNWCENRVRIDGPVDKIYNMAKAIEEERLLEYMVPLKKDGGYGTSATEHWGTKWDICEPYMEHTVEDGVIEVSFMSAWSPPIEAFDTYLSQNEDVTIEHFYYEPGNAYTGVDGEMFEVPDTKSDEWENNSLLQACDEVFGIREEMMQWEEENEEI